jgi:hypothetical protein
MPKCNMKGCTEEATKRMELAVGKESRAAELLVCERHLFELTDHGFKLVASLTPDGEVEIWRPSW